jgi:hypothetical protein
LLFPGEILHVRIALRVRAQGLVSQPLEEAALLAPLPCTLPEQTIRVPFCLGLHVSEAEAVAVPVKLGLRRHIFGCLKRAETSWLELHRLICDTPENDLDRTCQLIRESLQLQQPHMKHLADLYLLQPKQLKTVAEVCNPGRFSPHTHGDQCMFGLVTNRDEPMRKRSGFLTNNYSIAQILNQTCDLSHTHQHVMGRDRGASINRSRMAQKYPLKLIMAILAAFANSIGLPHDLLYAIDGQKTIEAEDHFQTTLSST